jgi:hypothetical protein
MKIKLPVRHSDSVEIELNCCWVTIGDYEYYFDDSIEGEARVTRWIIDDDTEGLESAEDIQE